MLPFTSERVHQFLGYEDRLFGDLTVTEYQEETRGHEALTYRPLPVEGEADRWQPSDLPPGQALQRPSVLFQKLDDSVVEEERARLEASAAV